MGLRVPKEAVAGKRRAESSLSSSVADAARRVDVAELSTLWARDQGSGASFGVKGDVDVVHELLAARSA
jgi:hypothetical protein